MIGTANVLLEAGVSHPIAVKDRAEELRADWTRLNKNVKKRMELAETFAGYLLNAQEVEFFVFENRSTYCRFKTVLCFRH